MDLTEGSITTKNNRAKKMMLWFGIASLIMSFAALTSAFIASKNRKDWIVIELPTAFEASLIVIILSSIFLYLSKLALKKNDFKKSVPFFFLVIICAVTFVLLQFYGFNQLIDKGYYPNGTMSEFLKNILRLDFTTNNITSSFVFVIAALHCLHVLAGLLCLIVVFRKLLNKKYQSDNMLGFELAVNFWHFVDVLWIYLFLFLVFFI